DGLTGLTNSLRSRRANALGGHRPKAFKLVGAAGASRRFSVRSNRVAALMHLTLLMRDRAASASTNKWATMDRVASSEGPASIYVARNCASLSATRLTRAIRLSVCLDLYLPLTGSRSSVVLASWPVRDKAESTFGCANPSARWKPPSKAGNYRESRAV